MDSRYFEPRHEALDYEDMLVYFCVFLMVLLSVATGIFSWAFVSPDLFM